MNETRRPSPAMTEGSRRTVDEVGTTEHQPGTMTSRATSGVVSGLEVHRAAVSLGDREGLLGAVRGEQGMAQLRERLPHDLPQSFLVLHDQDGLVATEGLGVGGRRRGLEGLLAHTGKVDPEARSASELARDFYVAPALGHHPVDGGEA